MFEASSCESAFELLLARCVGCISGCFDVGWHACVE